MIETDKSLHYRQEAKNVPKMILQVRPAHEKGLPLFHKLDVSTKGCQWSLNFLNGENFQPSHSDLRRNKVIEGTAPTYAIHKNSYEQNGLSEMNDVYKEVRKDDNKGCGGPPNVVVVVNDCEKRGEDDSGHRKIDDFQMEDIVDMQVRGSYKEQKS